MRISIASLTPHATWDLARQMQRLGHLGTLYTGVPRWIVDESLRPRTRTFPWLVAPINRLQRWLTPLGFGYWFYPLRYPVRVTFAQWLAKNLTECDVLVWLLGTGLEAQRVAKERYNALTVCNTGSTHALCFEEIVSEEHARWGVPYRSQTEPRLMERILKEYEECDLILVPSTFVYRSFVEKGVPERKLVMIPYGADLTKFYPVVKEDDIFRVVFAGQLSLRKGIGYLLEAVAPLRLPKFEVLIIGTPLLETRHILARYEGVFRHLTNRPFNELYRYYSQGSVFVMPSVEEGLALVQAQAMACGLPLIATANTGAEDLITDGIEGFIVPARSPEAIREKIVYLYENPTLRDQMAQAALQRAKRVGGWDLYGERVVAAFAQAMTTLRSQDQ